MGHGPFAARKTDAQSAANRRRSTRIDYETPIILSGRDAAGETYRDETITEIVNIHGARIRTERKVLVGMLVTVECVKAGRGSKGVCVNTYEPTAQTPHAGIAVQILQPGNIWGVENAPSDWAVVVATLGKAPSPAESSWSGVASATSPTPRVMNPPAAHPAEVPAVAQTTQSVIEESLEKLRAETDAITTNAISTYGRQLAEKGSQAEARLSQCVEQAASELAATVQVIREKMASDLIETSAEALRTRLEQVSREHEVRCSEKVGQIVADAEDLLAAKATEVADSSAATLELRAAEIARKAEADLTVRISEALQGFEAAFSTFRASFSEDLTAQQERASQEAEQAVRARVAALVSSIMAPPQPMHANPSAAVKK